MVEEEMMFLALIVLLADVKVYNFSVTRKQADVYAWKVPSGSFRRGLVTTKNCWEAATNEAAVIRFEKDSRENKMIFVRTGKVCEVTSVTFEEGRP